MTLQSRNQLWAISLPFCLDYFYSCTCVQQVAWYLFLKGKVSTTYIIVAVSKAGFARLLTKPPHLALCLLISSSALMSRKSFRTAIPLTFALLWLRFPTNQCQPSLYCAFCHLAALRFTSLTFCRVQEEHFCLYFCHL